MPDEQRQYYRSVPLVPKIEGDVDPKTAHWVYSGERLTGRIAAVLRVRQPLHVGSGQFVPPAAVGSDSDAPLIKAFYRAGDVVTIPGSSIKGAVRSLVEMITYSAVTKTRQRLSREQYGESTYNSRRRQGDVDPAGRMFGAMGYLGHIRFADAPLVEARMGVEPIPPQYQPRGDNSRRYYPHGMVDDRERFWPLEVALPGTTFRVTAQFENLEPAELGLLLIALGQGDPPICLKLGAGKSAGLGAVQFTELVAEKKEVPASYEQYEVSWSPVGVADCIRAAVETRVRSDNTLAQLQSDLGCGELPPVEDAL